MDSGNNFRPNEERRKKTVTTTIMNIKRKNTKKSTAHSDFHNDSRHKTGTFTNFYSTQTTKSIYILVSSIFFTSLSLMFIKVLSNKNPDGNVSNNTVIFYMGFYLLIFSLLCIKIDKIDLSLPTNFNMQEIDYLLIRSISGYFYLFFLVYALNSMRLVSAVTLTYIAPILNTVIVLKQNREKLKKNDKVFLCLAAIVVLIFLFQNPEQDVNSDAQTDTFKGVMYSLLTAVVFSINCFLDRKVCYEFHSYSILFVTGLSSVVLTPIFMSLTGEQFEIDLSAIVIYSILGFSNFMGFYFTHKSIEESSFLVNSPLHYITIGLAYVYAYYIFGEPFGFMDLFGGFLIIAVNYYMRIRMEDCENEDNV